MSIYRNRWLWIFAFGAWCVALWWLSSSVHKFPETVEIRVSDKVLHFGWFFGGAGLLSAALFLSFPRISTIRRITVAVVVLTGIGIVDEIHQSFVPGRSGNDVMDLLANIAGALVGTLVFQRVRGLFTCPAKDPSC